jgi:hypothetical protein
MPRAGAPLSQSSRRSQCVDQNPSTVLDGPVPGLNTHADVKDRSRKGLADREKTSCRSGSRIEAGLRAANSQFPKPVTIQVSLGMPTWDCMCLCRVGLYIAGGLSPNELADHTGELMGMVGRAQTRSPTDLLGVPEFEWHS